MKIIFYEKPGCTNNTRQKLLLEACGHEVNARSLLTQVWTAETLKPFFAGMPVAEWFNRAAPRIKSGELNPASFGENAALQVLIADPLLIRRPLLEAENTYLCGFDNEFVNALIDNQDASHLQSCPNLSKPCP